MLQYSEYLPHFLTSYILAYFLFEKISNIPFSKSLIVVINIILLYFFGRSEILRISNLNFLYPSFVLVGTTLFLMEDKRKSIKSLFIDNLFCTLSFFLLMTDIFPLHILALVCVLKSMKPNIKNLDTSGFECIYIGSLFILMLFQLTLTKSISYQVLESLVKEASVTVGMISFLFFIPIFKFISLVKNSLSKDDLVERGLNIWIWIGVYYSFILKLAIDINLHKYIEAKTLTVILCFLVIIMIFSTFKAENESSSLKKLWLLIIFNLAISAINSFINFSTPVTLFWANNLVILAFISINKSDGQRRFPLMVASTVLMVFFITIPFSPWFNFKYGLLAYYVVGKDLAMASLFLLLLGLNFRQGLLLLPELTRLVYSKKPNPS